jgi:hypothetical protein
MMQFCHRAAIFKEQATSEVAQKADPPWGNLFTVKAAH